MNKNIMYVLVVLLISAGSCSFTSKNFDNSDKDKLLIDLISYVLEKGHINPKNIDDDFSKNVYEDYINDLDPLKRYFLKKDIKEFEKYKLQIDDQIKEKDIAFFQLTYDRLLKRMQETQSIYKKILDTPFDYTQNETINVDYESQPYAKSEKERVEKWRKQLKFSTLSRYNSRLEDEARKKQEDPNYVVKTNAEIEKEARELTLKTITEYDDVMDELERKDWFTIYLNEIVDEFDPHTFYFAPEDKERFDISMSGKFEGIGARLQKRNDNIKIIEIISGGPAWRQNELEVGDEILRVAQGDEQPIDVVGMRLDDTVKLIKGPKGSEVKLTLKKVDGTTQVISITRDVVELEESYVKSATVKKENQTFGVINLPKFYIDFDDYKERNAASDVEKEIERLKASGVAGLVLDLRNNGGGSLKTVVDMAGLFIEKGPIVQVKATGSRKEVLKDKNSDVQWDGPLVILVNELSASASEILAAAMQDYKRAIILGSKQTYGKGTVQNVIDLNQFIQNSDYGDVGALKITTQKFYRINGGSTQLEGVKSDVIVPDRYSFIDIGEKDQDNPLPWDKIQPAAYKTWNNKLNFEAIIQKSNARIAANQQFKLIEENAKWIQKQQDNIDYPLNYNAYKKELEADEEMAKKFESIADDATHVDTMNLTFNSLPYEEKLMQNDSVLQQKRERWHKNLSKDIYIDEAINILRDLQLNNIENKKLAGVKG